jgi:hypothetical protein
MMPPNSQANAAQQIPEASLGAVPDYPVKALPDAARALVQYGVRAGLPPALLAGSALAALAAAMGPRAQIEVTPGWHERAILWVANLAPRGAGKTPSQDFAFDPLRSHDAQLDSDEPGLLGGDTTLEALARTLAASAGAAALDLDELAVLLRGAGEYKRGSSGDHGRLLSLWSGAPWTLTRVGQGKADSNAVKVRIARPTVVICGGLQTALHGLLGGEADGLRPRWLPHLATMPEGAGTLALGGVPTGWQLLLGRELIPARDSARTWRLSRAGRFAFESHRDAWKGQAGGVETASTRASLIKADVHLARVALVFAEAEQSAAGGEIGAELVERAAAVVDFSLDCWRALPEQGGLALSYRDERLDHGVERLVACLEERDGGVSTRRELQRACVAGGRTPHDLDLLLGRYEATYPGTASRDTPNAGGLETMIVRAPRRAVSAVSTLDICAAENFSPRAKSDPVSTADTDTTDTDLPTPFPVSAQSADTAPADTDGISVLEPNKAGYKTGDTGTADSADGNASADGSITPLEPAVDAGAARAPAEDNGSEDLDPELEAYLEDLAATQQARNGERADIIRREAEAPSEESA